jgi:quercetin dioxygenase-like cupin family protein
MEKHNKNTVLDDDILEMLAEAHEPVDIDTEVVMRMRSNLMQKISLEKTNAAEGFTTNHGADEDGWIEAFPGGSFKVLHGDASVPNSLLSYLIKLEPGFKMEGHGHPFDEETLMLEGDLTLGDIKLNAGDYHFAPAGVTHGNVSTTNGCIAYMRGALPV